jgi:colanic acid/amylovoran biosynthesis glycosyltransferase|uniref:Colanic acid biosynthesis glycosyltransferase WcaL n=1 Tax=Desulfobacca acetoxidans TaxID=60893 RepID=A0A7V6DQP6_9BACT
MPALAYFFSAYPVLTETLALHQVRATRDLGLPCILAANRRPAPDREHALYKNDMPRTLYLTPVSAGTYLRANVSAMARFPRQYAQAISLAWRRRDRHPWQRCQNLAHLLGAAVLADFLKGQDVCHVHVHFAYGAAEVALFLEGLCGIPYSLSIHGSDVLLENRLLEEKLRQARFLVSNCRYFVGNLKDRFPSLAAQKFYVVRGGVDMHASIWRPAPLPETAGILRLLHVARLVPVKAQHLLIEALAKLKVQGIPFACRIIGEGPLRPELENQARALGIQENVRFLGACQESAVRQQCDWSQAMVLSSRSEGTPMTIIEAMAKGRAVVAPRLTAIPEMIEDGKSGLLFTPGSAADLARQLARLACHPELPAQMGAEARRRAEKIFDLTVNAKTFLAVLAREVPALGLTPEVEIAPA